MKFLNNTFFELLSVPFHYVSILIFEYSILIFTHVHLENLPSGMAQVTHTMTLRRLLRNGLTYQRLQCLFQGSISFMDFFEKLNDIGIERKAAKAIASQFGSMGLSCRGSVEEDDRLEEAISKVDFCSEDRDENDSDSKVDLNLCLGGEDNIKSDSAPKAEPVIESKNGVEFLFDYSTDGTYDFH